MKNIHILFLISLSLSGLFSCGESQHEEENKISEISHLKGCGIGVLLGSIQDRYATDSLTESRIIRFDDISGMLTALEEGKCDAVILDNISGDHAIKKGKDLQYAIRGLAGSITGVGFSYDDDALRNQFNCFLKEIRDNGIYDDMHKRWVDDFDEDSTCLPHLELPVEGSPVRVGMSGLSIPFGYMKEGEWRGFEVEMMQRFSMYIRRPIEIRTIQFGALIAALTTGKIDVICSGLAITEERAKQVAFSDSYYERDFSCFTMMYEERKSEENISFIDSIEDLEGKRVAVLLGTIQDDLIREKLKKVEIIRLNNIPDIFAALDAGQCDAAVLDDVCLMGINTVERGFRIEFRDQFISKVGIGFRHKDKEMLASFNRFLNEIKENGIYDRIVRRWTEEFSPDTTCMPDIPLPTQGKPIQVGIGSITPPFEYLKEGKWQGMEIELFLRFAARIGRPVQFHHYEFGSLIASLQTEKVEVIIGFIFITEERARQVAFSDPVFQGGTACITKNRDGKKTVNDIAQLESCRLGVLLGSTHDIYAAKHYPKARLLRLDDNVSLSLALRTGQCDAILDMKQSCKEVLEAYPDFKVLDGVVFQDSLCAGFLHGEISLQQQFNRFLAQIKENGRWDEMRERWFSDRAPEESSQIKLPTKGEPLRAGVSMGRSAFTFLQDNRIAGFEPELLQRFALYLNRPLELIEMNFGALIPALISKKADVIVSTITVTPERREKILFSDSYFHTDVVCITKKDAQNTDSTSFWEEMKDGFYNNLILENRYRMIFDGLYITLIISLFSILLGTLFGGIICFMRMSRYKLASGFAKVYINLMRGIPILVFLMIMFYVVFASVGVSGVLIAIITFAINFSAYVSEMFRTSVESIDRGQTEAGIAMGFSKVKTFVFIVAPQAIRRVIPVFKGEAISLIKTTSIVGYIAIQDLTKISDIIRSRTFDAFLPLIVISVIYFILAWSVGLGLDYLSRKASSYKKS